MADPLVLRHDDGGVATLTLNRPEKLNALNPAMFVALRRHVEALAAADGIGCVVLNGAGRAFSAGHDLGAIASREPAPSRHYEPETIDLLEALPKPTIAAEIIANSGGTNRIDKALLAARGGMPRTAALLFERSLPFGFPADLAERMGRADKRR